MKRAVLLAIMGVLSATVFYAQEQKSTKETANKVPLAPLPNVCAVFPIYQDGENVLYYCEETTLQECQPLDVVYAWGGTKALDNVPDLCDDGCELSDTFKNAAGVLAATPALNRWPPGTGTALLDYIPKMASGQLTAPKTAGGYNPRDFFMSAAYTSDLYKIQLNQTDFFYAQIFGLAFKPKPAIPFPTRHRRRFDMAFGIQTNAPNPLPSDLPTLKGKVDRQDPNKVLVGPGGKLTVFRAK